MKKFIGFFLLMVLILVCIYANELYRDTAEGKYDIHKDLVSQISAHVPNYTHFKDLPEDMIHAIISVEDKRFFRHPGYDPIAIGRSIWVNVKNKSFRMGGSTITQQLAKNLFLTNEKTLSRKMKELIFTIKLEKDYSKEEILEMYLNLIYFGAGSYGIEDASQTYFNKSIDKLTLEECALLAGLPQSPSYYNPLKHMDRAKKRQKIVLNLMAKNGYIDNSSLAYLSALSFNNLLLTYK